MRFNIIKFICLSAFMIVVAGQVPAVQAQSVDSVLRSANQGNWTALNSLRQTSRDPATKKALQWMAYTRGGPNVSFGEITTFMAQNPDWPGQNTMRREAEERVSARTSASALMAFTKDDVPDAANAMDRYVSILLAQGQKPKAQSALKQWWPDARLTRNEQRDFYARYGQYLSNADHAKRLNVLIHKSQYENASAIANVLGDGYTALMKARKGLKANSNNVAGLIVAVPNNLTNDEGFLFDRLQWRRKKDLDSGAIEILKRAPKSSDMYSPKNWWRERHIIVRRMIERKQYAQAYALASAHRQTEAFPQTQAEWVSGWLALRLVNKPWEAFEHFEKIHKVTETPLSQSRGAYWAGRASDALKKPEVAQKWYNVAAQYKETYYGQLAAERLGTKAKLPSRFNPTVPSTERTRFNANDMVKATKWFHEAGLNRDRDLFLLALPKVLDGQAQYVQAIQMADQMGRRNIGIKIAQTLQKEKNIALYQYLYPMMVSELRGIDDVEWAFINAIIRQESRFDEAAISHAGARGLMQLMPATAKETARKAGRAHQLSWLTSKPDHNIFLGSRYLHQMTERYGGDYAYAAAAYNAGPGRVDRWLVEFGDPRRGEIDFLDWVELIPIYETRNYVQRVLEAVYVYRDQLGNKQKPKSGRIHTK